MTTDDAADASYKFIGEGAIVATSGDVWTLPPAKLYNVNADEEAKLERCNVYVITSSPRLLVDDCAVVRSGRWRVRWVKSTTPPKTIELEIDGATLLTPFQLPHPDPANLRLVIDGFGSELKLFDGDDTDMFGGFSAAEALGCIATLTVGFDHVAEYLDQTVEYVGQSQKTALHRLSKHSTLQKVLAELSQRQPHHAVSLMLIEFRSQENLVIFTPDTTDTSADLEASAAHAEAIWHAKVNSPQLTTLAEASMIRYFQPPYNHEYRFTFPRRGQSSYASYYQLEAHSVGFFLSTRGTGRRLGRSNHPPAWEHSAIFPLEGAANRRSLKGVFNAGGLQDFYIEPDQQARSPRRRRR